jgi:integrase
MPAVELLRGLPSYQPRETLEPGGSGLPRWVFPGRGKSGHLEDAKHPWQRIRERAGVPDVRIHDLRRTLGSWLAASGYSLPLIGRALNHSNVATTQVYARLSLDPVRDALERNAALMLAAK